MARTGNGTTAKIVSAALATPTAYSWHVWYRNSVVPSALTYTQPVGLGVLGASCDCGFSWSHVSAAFRQAVFHRASGYVAAKLTSTLAADTWYAIGGTWDGSNIRAYLNGVKEATTAATSIAGASPIFSGLAAAGGTASFDPGSVAEMAYWSIALTDQQMFAVGTGRRSPQLVVPQSLVIYWPLFGDSTEPDYSGAKRSGTVTGTTIRNHAPIMPGLF